MNLTKTVSAILGRSVTDHEAKEFSFNQFGTLAAYLWANASTNKTK